MNAKINNRFKNFGALALVVFLSAVFLLPALNNSHAEATKTTIIPDLSSEKVFETFKIDHSVSFYRGEDDHLIYYVNPFNDKEAVAVFECFLKSYAGQPAGFSDWCEAEPEKDESGKAKTFELTVPAYVAIEGKEYPVTAFGGGMADIKSIYGTANKKLPSKIVLPDTLKTIGAGAITIITEEENEQIGHQSPSVEINIPESVRWFGVQENDRHNKIVITKDLHLYSDTKLMATRLGGIAYAENVYVHENVDPDELTPYIYDRLKDQKHSAEELFFLGDLSSLDNGVDEPADIPITNNLYFSDDSINQWFMNFAKPEDLLSKVENIHIPCGVEPVDLMTEQQIKARARQFYDKYVKIIKDHKDELSFSEDKKAEYFEYLSNADAFVNYVTLLAMANASMIENYYIPYPNLDPKKIDEYSKDGSPVIGAMSELIEDLEGSDAYNEFNNESKNLYNLPNNFRDMINAYNNKYASEKEPVKLIVDGECKESKVSQNSKKSNKTSSQNTNNSRRNSPKSVANLAAGKSPAVKLIAPNTAIR